MDRDFLLIFLVSRPHFGLVDLKNGKGSYIMEDDGVNC